MKKKSEGSGKKRFGNKPSDGKRNFSKNKGGKSTGNYKRRSGKGPSSFAKKVTRKDDGLMRLNKFIAHCGICSRREADELITAGVIRVNERVATELGMKIDPKKDKVYYDEKLLRGEKMVYLLLNKPKGYISTVDDPRKRKTVMDLVGGACKERIYPVGRLDRATTGLLLMTNDGDLTTKLTHPRYGVKKVYSVTVDKNLKHEDLRKLKEGVHLHDGFAQADVIEFTGTSKKEVGMEIHMGKNRIVRRMFDNIGFEVVRLDRVLFAGLTKKNLPRGTYRFLTQKEVDFLKMK